MFRVTLALVCSVLAIVPSAFAASLPYTLDAEVVVVDDSNFENVISSHRTVLLEFYAPWCGHCKNLEPEYATVAKFIHKAQSSDAEFNRVVAKIDGTVNRNTAMAHSVSSFPTIILFQHGKSVEKYNGMRSFEDIMEYVKDMDASCADPSAAATGPASKSDPSGNAPAKQATRTFRYAPSELVEDGFVHLVGEDSMELLKGSDKPWLIGAFKNGCGHCRRMEAEWVAAVREVHASGAGDSVRIAVVDSEGMDREAPLMELLPGFRGTPGFFSYVPASVSPNGEGHAAQLVTGSRTAEMVKVATRRLAAVYSAEVDSVASVEAVVKDQPISVMHDVSFLLIASPDNPDAAAQVVNHRALGASLATGMFLHLSSSADAVAIAKHYGVEVSGTQSAVVAIDSRGTKLAGHVYISSSADAAKTQTGVRDWIRFKAATAFQWMSPVNQGSFFEGLKNLAELDKHGWSAQDAAVEYTSCATVMLAGFPDAEYRSIIDEAQAAHPNTVFYYQLGGYLQRRFLYGLHCPDVATTPCINVHPIDGPFTNVLRLADLLNGPTADRYTQNKRSSLLNMLEDFHGKKVRRQSSNVMDNIKMFGKIKAMALERGEDPNQPLDPSTYPPLSGPLPGKDDAKASGPKGGGGRNARERKQLTPEEIEAHRAKKEKAKAEHAARRAAEASGDAPVPKPKPKPKPAKAGSSKKAEMQRKLDEITNLVASFQKELSAMSDDDWE